MNALDAHAVSTLNKTIGGTWSPIDQYVFSDISNYMIGVNPGERPDGLDEGWTVLKDKTGIVAATHRIDDEHGVSIGYFADTERVDIKAVPTKMKPPARPKAEKLPGFR